MAKWEYSYWPGLEGADDAVKEFLSRVPLPPERPEPPIEVGERIRDVACPQCKQAFRLTWNDYSNRKQTVFIMGCPSGGTYAVEICCPHCDYKEEL